MPIYEYECNECQGCFEKLVFGDDEVECPDCGLTLLIIEKEDMGE